MGRRDNSKSVSPREGLVDRTVPAELTNKVARVREAVSAVQKQLSLSVLTGKKFEKLELQAETLDRVKSALETLKPKVKKTEKDLELVSGSLSMEYFEKLTSQGEKCHDEWVKVNKEYQEKRKVLSEAKQELDTFDVMIREAKDWLEEKERMTLTWKQVRMFMDMFSFWTGGYRLTLLYFRITRSYPHHWCWVGWRGR